MGALPFLAFHGRSRLTNNESLLRQEFFRGSFPRLLYSLSTLHKLRHRSPCKTRFRRLATPYRTRCTGFPVVSLGYAERFLLFPPFTSFRVAMVKYSSFIFSFFIHTLNRDWILGGESPLHAW
jgi:hypothetical protein